MSKALIIDNYLTGIRMTDLTASRDGGGRMKNLINPCPAVLMVAIGLLTACAPTLRSSAGEVTQVQHTQTQTAQTTLGVDSKNFTTSAAVTVGAGVGFTQTTTTVTNSYSSPEITTQLLGMIARYLPGELDRYAESQRPEFERFQPDVTRGLTRGEQAVLSFSVPAGAHLRLVGECGVYCQAIHLEVISPEGQVLSSMKGERLPVALDVNASAGGSYRLRVTLTELNGASSAQVGLMVLLRR